MDGAVISVNTTPALGTPPTVTTVLPVVVPSGTASVMFVALQLVRVVTSVPLNVTALDPWVVPKFVPVMVIQVPIGPEFGDRLVMVGVGSTVKFRPLLR